MTRFFQRKHLKAGFITLLIMIISFPAIFRLLRPGFFPMYDDMQVIRVEQMDKCIKDGQIPCRWVPDLGYGYGYPLFQYYSPLPYYFMEGVYLLGFSFIDSVKIGFIASIVFSALFFYLLAKKYFGILVSLLLAFIYVLLPFRAADVYVRGAMGEAWGLAFLPAYLWGFEKYLNEKKRFSFLLFSLLGALFLITHNLTFFMSIPLLAVWFFMRLKDNRKIIKYVILSVILSLSISSFYIFPLIAERNLVHIETMTRGYFNFISHFSSIKQIFFSTHWGYGPSVAGASDDAFLGIGPIHAVLGVAGFIACLVKKRKNSVFFSLLLGLAFFYSFLMHSRSVFIWQTFPFMKYFQFPWRFSLAASFIFTFLTGCLFEKIPKLIKPVFYLLSILVIIYFYGKHFTPKTWLTISDTQKLSGELRQLSITASIYDYLPKSAKVNPAQAAPDNLIIEKGEVNILSSLRGTNWYKYVLDVVSDNALVIIPAYDFPGWRVKVNSQNVAHEPYGELGLLALNLTRGENVLEARLEKTPLKIFSDAISLVSLFAVLIFMASERNKRRKMI